MPALRPRWSKSNRIKRTVTKWKKLLKVAEEKMAEDKANPRYSHSLSPRDQGNSQYLRNRVVTIKDNIAKLEKEIG